MCILWGSGRKLENPKKENQSEHRKSIEKPELSIKTLQPKVYNSSRSYLLHHQATNTYKPQPFYSRRLSSCQAYL